MNRTELDSTRATRVTLILAFIAASLLFVIDRSNQGFLERQKMAAGSTVVPIVSLVSRPVRALENIIGEYQDRSRAMEENKALKEELYSLREEKERADIVAMKLARFEQIFSADFGIDIPNKKIAARAVSEVNGPFVRAGLINVGTRQGVKAGHPVMTIDGLYGHVLKAGKNSARVLRLDDLNSRVAIMSNETEATAILAGDNSDRPLLIFASEEEDWPLGSPVITSGDDGVLPRGLPIGTVALDGRERLVVNLNVTGKSVDWVWVYPFEPIDVPEDNLPEEEVPAPDLASTSESAANAEGTP